MPKQFLVTMGSITGTARVVVDEMRREGKPIGLVKLRVFRPFPTEEMQEIGRSVRAIGFVDRNISHGSAGGGVGTVETARALYTLDERPVLIGFYAGLVGRDVVPSDIRYMADRVLKAAETGKAEKQVEWIGLRKQATSVQVTV
jgi:pyruvate ferredoxin oxidoreductase alpha subunit